MSNIEWEKVAEVVAPNTDRVPYKPNKHLFTKVAFDVYQYNNGITESLWTLEKDENGEEYLVAQYDDGSEVQDKPLQSKSSWEALSDQEGANVTLYYRGVPIKRLTSSDYSFDKSDVHIFKSAVTKKLSDDKGFVSKLLDNLPEEKRESLINSFPELKQ